MRHVTSTVHSSRPADQPGTAASRDHTTTQNWPPVPAAVELRWWLPNASSRVSRSHTKKQHIIDEHYRLASISVYLLHLFQFRVARVAQSTTFSPPGDDRLCRGRPIDLRTHPPLVTRPAKVTTDWGGFSLPACCSECPCPELPFRHFSLQVSATHMLHASQYLGRLNFIEPPSCQSRPVRVLSWSITEVHPVQAAAWPSLQKVNLDRQRSPFHCRCTVRIEY